VSGSVGRAHRTQVIELAAIDIRAMLFLDEHSNCRWMGGSTLNG
jgi:hypothetical protein